MRHEMYDRRYAAHGDWRAANICTLPGHDATETQPLLAADGSSGVYPYRLVDFEHAFLTEDGLAATDCFTDNLEHIVRDVSGLRDKEADSTL